MNLIEAFKNVIGTKPITYLKNVSDGTLSVTDVEAGENIADMHWKDTEMQAKRVQENPSDGSCVVVGMLNNTDKVRIGTFVSAIKGAYQAAEINAPLIVTATNNDGSTSETFNYNLKWAVRKGVLICKGL
jgi:hypothetical protein